MATRDQIRDLQAAVLREELSQLQRKRAKSEAKDERKRRSMMRALNPQEYHQQYGGGDYGGWS